MSKAPQTKNGPSATDALVNIIELSLPFRTDRTPSVDLVARLAAQGSRLLRLGDDTTAVQNAAVLGLMKKHKLIAD
jgi:hypothetical protein